MSSHSFRHPVRNSPAASVFYKANPLTAGLDRSPCKCRPDTGQPCVRLYKDKMHPTCNNCAVLRKGRADCVDPLNYNYVASEYINTKNELHPCKWRGCINKTRSRYCQRHGMVAYQREKQWRTNHPGKPVDENWLFRPIRPKVKRV